MAGVAFVVVQAPGTLPLSRLTAESHPQPNSDVAAPAATLDT